MKQIKCIYGIIIICSTILTSCVSYQATGYNNSKNKKPSTSTIPNSPTTKKKTKSKDNITSKPKNTESYSSSSVKTVIKEAEKYRGTPYKYGGNTSSGIDCSGLVCIAFNKIDKKLPRRSIDMSKEGSSISLSKVKIGDLLFFATGGGSINHVGIVHDTKSSGEIFFIHASTSKGVIVSSLEEKYWKGKFVKARRVL